ncbi:unnamed protein product, partial [Mesorhabditis spiculigera]
MQCDARCLGQIVFVSAIWGATNPLMRLGTKYQQEKKPGKGLCGKVVHFLSNWRFIVPFLLNQAGGLLFTYLVVHLPVSVVVPATNSLQFVFAAIAGALLGETLSARGIVSCLLILGGVVLMVFGDVEQPQQEDKTQMN